MIMGVALLNFVETALRVPNKRWGNERAISTQAGLPAKHTSSLYSERRGP